MHSVVAQDSEEEDEHDDTASRPVEGPIVIEDAAPVVPEEPQVTDQKKWSRGDIAILTVQRNKKDLDGFEAKILVTKAKEVKVELLQGPKKNTKKTLKYHNLIKKDAGQSDPANSSNTTTAEASSAGTAASSSSTAPAEPASKRAKVNEDATASLFDRDAIAGW